MPIQNTGSDIRLRGNAGDGVTDINEEIKGNSTDTDVSLGTLNTELFTAVDDGSVITGRAMSEMQGQSIFDSQFPATEATGALGESIGFSGSDNSRLMRALSIAGSPTTATISCWVKRAQSLSGRELIFFTSDSNGADSSILSFEFNNDYLKVIAQGASINSSYQFKDTTSWYHIVVAMDTTKTYANDRCRIYVNGIENGQAHLQSFTPVSQNTANLSKSNHYQTIGDRWLTGSRNVNSTIADVKFIDGQQLRPDSFGKLHEGIWIPQAFNTPSTDTLVTSNLIANYEFNNSSNDISGSGTVYNGTDTGVTYYATNQGIVDFNASSDKIVLPSGIATEIRTAQAFTVGLWFFCDGLTSTDQQIFHMLNNTYLLIRIDGGTDYIEAYWGNGNDGTFYQLKTRNNFVKEKTWYNVIVTANANEEARLFVNGSLQDTTSGWDGTFMTYTNSNYAFNMLGQQGSNVHPFDGKIGECQVYKAGLTPEQALQNYNATKHKYAYGINGLHLPLNNTSIGTIDSSSNLKLHLDASNNSSYGGSGPTWTDLTSNSNNGTISGANFLSTTNGGVFNFDGSNDKVEITTIKDDVDNGQDVSMEVWFNCSSSQSGEGIICGFAGSSGDAGMDIGIKPSTGLIYMSQGSGSTGVAGYDVRDNKWHHAVMTMTSSVKNLYLDGVLIDSSAATNRGTFPNDFHIGTWADDAYDGYYFNGKIAQVRIYDKVLLANEVITNYRATQGNYEQVSTVDISGNANSFTATSIDYTDHIKDEPLDNYATLNPLAENTGASFSEGNLKVVSQQDAITASLAVNSGKWYAEATMGSITNVYIGIFGADGINPNMGGNWTSVGAILYKQNGDQYSLPKGGSSSTTSYGASFTSGDVIGIALDLDSSPKTITFYKNGSTQGATANAPTHIGTNQYTFGFYAGNSGATGTATFNFGQKNFAYTIPSGFKALSTKNLPAPSINPDTATPENPSDYFKAVIYQGNGGTQGEAYGYKEGSRAAVFNGSSSYINIPSTIYSSITGPFTLSAWINTTSSGSYKIIMGMGGVNGVAAKGLTMWINPSGKLHASWGNGSAEDYWTNSATTSINTGNWFHVAITVNGLTNPVVKGYVNGAAEGSGSTGNDSITFDSSFTIGTRNSGGNLASYWDGEIDQVRIFNKELSSTEVGYLYNDDTANIANISNQVSHYDMEGDSNNNKLQTITSVATYQLNNAATSIPNNTYPGTLVGSPTYTSGKYGQAINFTSDNQYINTGLTPTILGTSFAASCWVYFTSNTTGSDYYGIMGAYSSNGSNPQSWILYNNNGTLTFFSNIGANVGGGSISFTGGTIELNKWNHVVFSVDHENEVNLYLNNLKTTQSNSSQLRPNSVPLCLGNIGTYNASRGMIGKMDQVRIFNTAIGSETVAALYNETTTTAQSASVQGALAHDGTDSNVIYTQDKPYGNINVGFAPDFVWIKQRNGSASHSLQDTVRGAGQNYNLYPDNNAYQGQYGSYGYLSSFDTNGFTVEAGSGNHTNGNRNTYVSWNWKAGGTPTATNTASAGAQPTLGSVMIDGVASTAALAGSLAAKKISANTKSGVSIVKYTGTGSATNIAHGLNKKPDLIIFKGIGSTGTSDAWPVYASSITADFTLYLYHTYAAINDAANFNDTEPTSSVFTVGTWNGINKINVDYIAYCFHSVDSFSKIGSYTGNGSSDGPFVHTGFKPAFLLIKNTSNAFNWYIRDNARSTNNPLDLTLAPNLGSAEDSAWSDGIDFLSNGFKVKLSTNETNQNNNTFLYMAFAEDSEKHSNAVATLDDGNEFIQDANYPQDNFSATTYSGNSSTQKITTGVDADFVWIKNKSHSLHHYLTDSVRGEHKVIFSSSNSQEYDGTSSNDGVDSFDSDGFILQNGTNAANYNQSTRDYVAWSWKAAGHEYKSASFNGSSGKIDLPLTSLFGGKNTLSVSFWFNTTTTSRQRMFTDYAQNSRNCDITIDGGNIEIVTDYGSTSDKHTTTSTYNDSNWHHLVVAISSTQRIIYIDNTEVDTITLPSGSWNGSGQKVTLGAFYSSTSGYSQYFDGKIDQVRIFNKGILATEVTNLYNETKSTVDTLQVLGDASCIATYRLNGDARDLSGNYHGTESNIDYHKGGHFTYNIYENKVRTFSHKASDLNLNTGTIIPDAINVNRDNGFSIVKYTGNGIAGSTITHGLSSKPELFFIKQLTATRDTIAWCNEVNTTLGYLNHNDTFANSRYSWAINSTQPSATDITFNNDPSTNGSGNYIAYCFNSVPGFSKIGSFTGTGSSGNKIFTGFEPAFLMVKGTSIAGNWTIFDNQRPNENLWANLDNSYGSASTTNNFSFNSDGFTSLGGGGSTNSNNHNYIYIAFAHR